MHMFKNIDKIFPQQFHSENLYSAIFTGKYYTLRSKNGFCWNNANYSYDRGDNSPHCWLGLGIDYTAFDKHVVKLCLLQLSHSHKMIPFVFWEIYT